MSATTAAALVYLAQAAPDNPATWLTSLIAAVPAVGVMWWILVDFRKDRDVYREALLRMLPEYHDAIRAGALAQEKLAAALEERMLAAAEIVKLRRLLERNR